MKRFSLMLLGAVGAFFVLSPARAADFRVIQWNASRACQIYDFSWGFRPIPPDYRVLTKSLPSYSAALSAKNALARRARCSV
jgi:hypothetical protein